MITPEELKQTRPDLVKLFNSMSKEELIEQCYLECTDAINMETRVATFMRLCTNMSKTNYTVETIETLVAQQQEDDINEFCKDLMEDNNTPQEITNAMKGRVKPLVRKKKS